MDAPISYAVTGFGKTLPRHLANSVPQAFPQPLVKTTRYIALLFRAGDAAEFQIWNSSGEGPFLFAAAFVLLQNRSNADYHRTNAVRPCQIRCIDRTSVRRHPGGSFRSTRFARRR